MNEVTTFKAVFPPMNLTAIGGAGCAVAMTLRANMAQLFGSVPPCVRTTCIDFENDQPSIPEELRPRLSPEALRKAGLSDADRCLLSSDADMKALAERMRRRESDVNWLNAYCDPDILSFHPRGKEGLQQPAVVRLWLARAANGLDASRNWVNSFGDNLDALSRYGPALQATARQFGHSAVGSRSPVLSLTVVGAQGGTGGGGAILSTLFQRQEAARHRTSVEFHLHVLTGYRGHSASLDRQQALASQLIIDIGRVMKPTSQIRLPRHTGVPAADWNGRLWDSVQLHESNDFLTGNFAESVWAAADALLARYFSPSVQKLSKDWDNVASMARERELSFFVQKEGGLA